MEPQLAVIFERVLGPHQRARRHFEPVDKPRQQEPQRRAAREQGVPLSTLQSRLKLWLAARPPDHFLVIEPEEELRAIVVSEIAQAVPFPVRGAAFDACRDAATLAHAVPVVLPSKFEKVRAALPADSECIALQVRSVPASLGAWDDR